MTEPLWQSSAAAEDCPSWVSDAWGRRGRQRGAL